MGGTGTVPHCAVFSSFAATTGKDSRAAAGGASFRTVSQPFKCKKKLSFGSESCVFCMKVYSQMIINTYCIVIARGRPNCVLYCASKTVTKRQDSFLALLFKFS